MPQNLRVIAILFVALGLVPAGAHLFSMWSKLQLKGGEYLVSQRAYDGWNLFAFVVIGSLLATAALTVALYRAKQPAWPAALAFLCIAATQVIFWTFTFPANRATENWTVLPDSWQTLRSQWEYSHAASALLHAAALTLLVFDTKG